MLTDLLLSEQSPWTKGEGDCCDVVLSSRIRLARNYANHLFPNKQDRESAFQVWKIVLDAVADKSDYSFCDLNRLEDLERQVLVEKHLISPVQANIENGYRALALRDDMAVAVMVNEEDHLRTQCFAPGLELKTLWKEACQVDDLFGQEKAYSFDDQLGYLTACPTNVGTGMRASVLLHLPALDKTGGIRMLNQLPSMGMTVRGLFGEGSEAVGHFYQVSNQQSLGYSEEELLNSLQNLTLHIVDEERKARQQFTGDKLDFEDKVWRALGILMMAKKMTLKEAFEFLSFLRVGVALGFVSEITFSDMDPLFAEVQAGSLQYNYHNGLEEKSLDQVRAQAIQKRLGKGKGVSI